jgi:hypothetical protein
MEFITNSQEFLQFAQDSAAMMNKLILPLKPCSQITNLLVSLNLVNLI